MRAGSAVVAGTVLEPEDQDLKPEEAAGAQAETGSGTEREMENPKRNEGKKTHEIQ